MRLERGALLGLTFIGCACGGGHQSLNFLYGGLVGLDLRSVWQRDRRLLDPVLPQQVDDLHRDGYDSPGKFHPNHQFFRTNAPWRKDSRVFDVVETLEFGLQGINVRRWSLLR